MFCCKSNNAVIVSRDLNASQQTQGDSSILQEQAQNNIPTNDDEYQTFLSQPSRNKRRVNNNDQPLDETSSDITSNPIKFDDDRVQKNSRVSSSIRKDNVIIPSVLTTTSSDDISTVYEEPPKAPKGSFVLLPDAPQRGYEPYSRVEYGPKEKWTKRIPYRIGTLVWYRCHGLHKLKWYIPGIIEDYVFNNLNKSEVIAYKIGVEISADEHAEMPNDQLANAEPENVMLRWDEKEPICPVKGISMRTSKNDSSDRIAKFVEDFGEDLGYKGARQNGLGPEMWGITLDQLQEIAKLDEYDSNMSMYDIVNTIVKPRTQGTGMGYSLLLNKDEPLRAKVMVSHAWGENYNQFLETLQKSGSEGPFWVCAFSIYQNNDLEEVTISKQLGPDPHYGPFATVLRQSDLMIAIMTQSCDIYTRLWCVYEIFVAISMNIPVKLETYNEITGMGGSDQMYSNVVLDSTGRAVSTMTAECGYDGDKMMIHNEISKQKGGFALIDDVLMWVRIMALIDDLPNCKKKSWNESQMRVPLGSCSASNIVARQNAGIANALRVWQEAKNARQNMSMSIHHDMSKLSDESGFLSFLRDKLCGGSSYCF